MWMMWLGAAVVIGLIVGLYIKRSMARAAKVDSFRGKVAPCPACNTNVVEVGTWKRTALIASRGELFECAACGHECGFDMDRTEPLLVYSGKKKQPKPTPPADTDEPATPQPAEEQPRVPWWRRRKERRKRG